MSSQARLSLVDRSDRALSIVAQCQLLRVPRSTLYYQPAPVDADDLAVMRQMDEIYLERPFYGSRRMAVELARRRPERVRRLVLMSVPYFVGAEQAVWRHRLARPHTLTDDLNQLESRWRRLVIDREWGMSLERGFEAFVDELRAYPNDWWAHDAAFGFDVETAFAEVQQPVLVLNPANTLAQASRRAAWALPDGQLLDLPLLHDAPFDVGAEELAERIDEFLRSS